MNYELAKQLKEAGFPQRRSQSGNYFPRSALLDREEDIACPSLEELIEACGEQFDSLFSGFERIDEGYSHKNQWRADATNRTGYSCAGETPTEAVARLWLALNQ